jgi:hypothetical protein
MDWSAIEEEEEGYGILIGICCDIDGCSIFHNSPEYLAPSNI